MPSPIAYRANYDDLYSASALPVLEMLFDNEFMRHPSLRSMLFNVRSTQRDIWQYSEVHDLPFFNQMSEGEEYDFASMKQGASKTFVVQKFGLGVSFSEELISDGKFDLVAKAIRKLASAGAETQEVDAINIFNNGFTTELSADGQNVFDTDHSLPSGGSFRNELSVSADLSPTSLETALIDFEQQFIGDGGEIKNIRPRKLLVPSSLKRTAMEIVGSQLKADTADNNLNPFLQDDLQVVCSPHLTDPDAWFLLADNSDTGLEIIERQSMQTKGAGPDVGYLNDSIFYKASYREDLGVTHAYGIYGSPGA